MGREEVARVRNDFARGVLVGVPNSILSERLLYTSICKFNQANDNMCVELKLDSIRKDHLDSEKKKQMEKVCSKMFGCLISTPHEGGRAYDLTPIFDKMTIDIDECIITVKFKREVLPFILNVRREFTMVPIEMYNSLKSKYSQKLYRILKSYSGLDEKATVKYAPDTLVKLLSAPEKNSKNNGWFRKQILNPAIEEINDIMDITIKYDVKKEGRKIVRYDFNIKLKKKKVKNEWYNGLSDSSKEKLKDKQKELDSSVPWNKTGHVNNVPKLTAEDVRAAREAGDFIHQRAEKSMATVNL